MTRVAAFLLGLAGATLAVTNLADWRQAFPGFVETPLLLALGCFALAAGGRLARSTAPTRTFTAATGLSGVLASSSLVLALFMRGGVSSIAPFAALFLVQAATVGALLTQLSRGGEPTSAGAWGAAIGTWLCSATWVGNLGIGGTAKVAFLVALLLLAVCALLSRISVVDSSDRESPLPSWLSVVLGFAAGAWVTAWIQLVVAAAGSEIVDGAWVLAASFLGCAIGGFFARRRSLLADPLAALGVLALVQVGAVVLTSTFAPSAPQAVAHVRSLVAHSVSAWPLFQALMLIGVLCGVGPAAVVFGAQAVVVRRLTWRAVPAVAGGVGLGVLLATAFVARWGFKAPFLASALALFVVGAAASVLGKLALSRRVMPLVFGAVALIALAVSGAPQTPPAAPLPSFVATLSGQLGLWLNPSAQRVLVLGRGDRQVLDAVLAREKVATTVADAEPGAEVGRATVVSARAVWQQPSGSFDVVVNSERIVAKTSALLTSESVTAIKALLSDSGCFVQPVELVGVSDDVLRLVVRTLRSQFAELTAWQAGETGLVLVASRVPLAPNFVALNEQVRPSAWSIEGLGVLGLQRLSDGQLTRFAGEGPLNSRDHDRLGALAPRARQAAVAPSGLPDARRHPSLWKELLVARALDARPLDAEFARSLARALAVQQKPDDPVLRSAARAWVNTAPDDREARALYARTVLAEGEPERASEFANSDLEFRVRLATSLRRQGRNAIEPISTPDLGPIGPQSVPESVFLDWCDLVGCKNH